LKGLVFRAGIAAYRRLPASIHTRRRIRALAMRVLARSGGEFQKEWRGMRVWIDPEQALDMRLHLSGDYEPETLAALERLAVPGSSVIDVGAHVGLVAMWLSRCVTPAGRVIAVEPSGWACTRMARNLDLSRIANVEVVHAAAWDAEGSAQMNIINGYRNDDTNTRRPEQVALVTVDALVEARGIADLSVLKIDTDGHESYVLRGALATIGRLRPAILFEFGPDHMRRYPDSDPDALIGLLHGLGYTVTRLDGADFDPEGADLGPFETINLVAVPHEKARRPR